jgi:Flp pilus assembly protein CpaB
MIDDGAGIGAPVRVGERVAQLTALGPAELIVPGVRVDVIVTSDRGGGSAEVVLQDAEVLKARAVPADDAGGAEKVEAALRVRSEQVQSLARAEDYAHAVRIVPRAAGDRHRLRNR